MDSSTYARELASIASLRIAANQYKTAEACLRKAISIDPTQPGYSLNLASTLLRLGKPQEALMISTAILEAMPNVGGAWSISGLSYLALGRYAESRDAFATAVMYDPHNTNHRIDYSASLMLLGEWDEGWAEYEHRVVLIGHNFVAPPFEGSLSDMGGKHILVSSEQGSGDTIQFSRYVPLIAQHAQKVTFAVPATMYSLFSGLGVDLTVRGTVVPGGYDAEVLLHSAPRLFDTAPDTVPADPGKLNYAEMPKLQSRSGFNVGICWAGSTGHTRDCWRSIPFEAFLPLAGSGKWDLFSFQVGKQAPDISLAGAQSLITDLSGLIESKWSAAATFLKGMDAVVSCDTGIAHLAAALGIPTCLITAAIPDWRWLVTTEDKTPWYPSMKVIRQVNLYQWDYCIGLASEWLESLK